MESKKNVDMSASKTTVKVVKSSEIAAKSKKETKETSAIDNTDASKTVSPKTQTKKKIRSKKYVTKRSCVDKTKTYSTSEAVSLIKNLSYSKFDGTITLDGVVGETGKIGTFSLPHSTGKLVAVVIADDKVIEKIAAGNIDFDVLLTTPAFMPKLAKYARILGPKGLMPNPKNGTVTSKPKEKKAELEKGSFDLKTEKKRPVIHVTVGKVSHDTKNLVKNIDYLLDSLKGKLQNASISATMSPSIKIEVKSI